MNQDGKGFGTPIISMGSRFIYIGVGTPIVSIYSRVNNQTIDFFFCSRRKVRKIRQNNKNSFPLIILYSCFNR